MTDWEEDVVIRRVLRRVLTEFGPLLAVLPQDTIINALEENLENEDVTINIDSYAKLRDEFLAVADRMSDTHSQNPRSAAAATVREILGILASTYFVIPVDS